MTVGPAGDKPPCSAAVASGTAVATGPVCWAALLEHELVGTPITDRSNASEFLKRWLTTDRKNRGKVELISEPFAGA